MKAKPNIDAFLESGTADIVNTTEPPQSVAKIYREQKVFRLPIDLINALKKEAYEQSIKTGSRVTETELVEQALRAFLKVSS
jgi:hypothetical protein